MNWDLGFLEWSEEEARWRSRAACAGMPKEMFYAERGEDTKEAKEVCRGCPVREPCLDYALSNAEKFGIWGGKAERERRQIRYRRNRRIRLMKEETNA